MEEVDWDRLGGSFEPIKPIRVKAPTPPRPSVDLTKAKLLLDDEEEENAPTTNNSNANSSSVNGTPSGGRPSSASKAAPKILLDDE
ncbi:hypothetical protein ADEAN_000766300 [Angomonas deanei]|uniref:Uncharacterized protein n=1 Tax=Angomonas deanei TaxID=59799 RepID=A0A7G2CJV8_9TRYP|nr:hypothetical protein ADEAN_000766300 [Angomonas deanei]